jgi:HAD superfamily hydrolase (TIGR01509 family)
VLFDLDGVVIDSERLKSKTHTEIILSNGGHIPSDAYQDVIGQSAKTVYQYLSKLSGVKIDYQEYQKLFYERYTFLLTNYCKPTEGFESFFIELKKLKIKMGLVTSTSKKTIELITRLFPLINSFDCIISEDDVLEHKPSPLPYLKALEVLGSIAKNTIIFEDTMAGIESANAAKVKVIGLMHHEAIKQNYRGTIAVWENFIGKTPRSLVEIFEGTT